MDKKTQYHLWYVLAAMAGLLLFQALWTARNIEQIPYSRFQQLVKEGKIAEAVVYDSRIEGTFKDGVDKKRYFVTQRVTGDIAGELDKRGVKYRGGVENTFLAQVLSWVLPIAIFFVVWAFFFRRFAERQGIGGLMSVGKSRAKVYVEKETGVTFADVAGV
ncbi:MAG: ATP-dependent metallopeptidase FtsH/Yme1/Tma family protein, partial [Hyphomicrobiaceae bacterium]|nr:ATP-dependent metallopeptidase FtsH/Yme1/Tma family protein [Hyphomicrobiaceae bacterium]